LLDAVGGSLSAITSNVRSAVSHKIPLAEFLSRALLDDPLEERGQLLILDRDLLALLAAEGEAQGLMTFFECSLYELLFAVELLTGRTAHAEIVATRGDVLRA
jgi:hypothetical protein